MEDLKEGETETVSKWRTLVKRGEWTWCLFFQSVWRRGFFTQMMDLLQILQATRHLEDKAGSGEESCSPVQLHTKSSLSHHTHKSPLIPVSAHMSTCQNLEHACRSQLDQTILITTFLIYAVEMHDWLSYCTEMEKWECPSTITVMHAVIFSFTLASNCTLLVWRCGSDVLTGDIICKTFFLKTFKILDIYFGLSTIYKLLCSQPDCAWRCSQQSSKEMDFIYI